MRNLTRADKEALLERITSLGPEHWEMVKRKIVAEEKEFLKHEKALSVSHIKLTESFDI